MGRAVFADDEPLSMATTDLSPERPIREGSSSRGPAQEGGLPELFDAVRWRWRPTVLIALLFFLGATIYVERSRRSTTARRCSRSLRGSVHRMRARTRFASAHRSTWSTSLLRPPFGGSPPASDEDPATLQDAVGAQSATDTGNVTITVRLPSPTRAARAANAFADSALAFSQTDQQLTAELVAPALAPSDQVALRRGACSRPRRSSSA